MTNVLLVWRWYRDRFGLVISGAILLMMMAAAAGHGDWPQAIAWFTAFFIWSSGCRVRYRAERWRKVAHEQRTQLELLVSDMREEIRADAKRMLESIAAEQEEILRNQSKS